MQKNSGDFEPEYTEAELFCEKSNLVSGGITETKRNVPRIFTKFQYKFRDQETGAGEGIRICWRNKINCFPALGGGKKCSRRIVSCCFCAEKCV